MLSWPPSGKLKVSELLFEVPKNHSDPSEGVIQVFARSVARHDKPAAVPNEEDARKSQMKPWFVFLQGEFELLVDAQISAFKPQGVQIYRRGFLLWIRDKTYWMMRNTHLHSPFTPFPCVTGNSLVLRLMVNQAARDIKGIEDLNLSASPRNSCVEQDIWYFGWQDLWRCNSGASSYLLLNHYHSPSPQNSRITETLLDKGYQILYLDVSSFTQIGRGSNTDPEL